MSKALIRLKKKPAKPKRRQVTVSLNLDDGTTLKEILEHFGDVPSESVVLEQEYPYHDESSAMIAKYTRPQTDEEFEEVVAAYRERKSAYDSWYDSNKALIEKEVGRREGLLILQRQRRIVKERRQLDKELSKLHKRIRRM